MQEIPLPGATAQLDTDMHSMESKIKTNVLNPRSPISWNHEV